MLTLRSANQPDGYCPVTTLPGSAVGAWGAITDGVKEFGPPGVSVGAFSVAEAGGPDGGGPLGDGEGLCWVGTGDSLGSSLPRSELQPAIHVAAPAIAIPPTSTPIRRSAGVSVTISSCELRLSSGHAARVQRCWNQA